MFFSAFPCLFPTANHQVQWSIPSAVQLACVLEATAPKIGNVHPGRAFKDMTYDDFLVSANALRSALISPYGSSIGELTLAAVNATRREVAVNTNLGMILLLVPLAKAYSSTTTRSRTGWRSEVRQQLASLTAEDCRFVYQAIQVAKPGGIGEVQINDIRSDAPTDLIAAMRQVAEFDAVARQYTNDFEDIFCTLAPWLDEALELGRDTFSAICEIQLRWLAKEPDGLIVRKAGNDIASQIQKMAAQVLAQSEGDQRHAMLIELNNYLGANGNRCNPGTTADLIAATLFVRLLSA